MASAAPPREPVITSAANPEIKALRALAQKKERQERGLFVSEGLRHVLEAIRAGWRVERLFVADDTPDGPRLREAAEACRRAGGRVIAVSGELMSRIARRDNAQSVVAVIGQRWGRLDQVGSSPETRWLALEEVRDPGNLGSVVRSADAFGFGGLILVGNATDPYSQEAVRASMGSIVNLPLVRAGRQEFVDWRRGWPGRTVGTHLSGRVHPEALEAGGPVLLIMGNEQSGLSDTLAETCDVLVRIPMRAGADSLNLAAATAIMLYRLGAPGAGG